jgi:glycosyltransferase involved in cell wall biosynthesis
VDQKIDVVLLTKNSLRPCLRECVDSIFKNIPVHTLIVVDGGSTDGTLELVKEYPNIKIIDDAKGTRATARQKGIEAAETDWHAQVDSDAILCSGWFEKAWKKVDDNVGAVWGAAIPNDKHFFNMSYAMSKLYRISVKDLMVKQMRSERCMMHDTLIRTNTVKGIQIPAGLHIWEDDYIGRYIIKKGYRFLKVGDPYCLHNVTPNERFEGYVTAGYLMKKCGIGSFKQVLRWLVSSVPKAAWILIITRDIQASKIQFLSSVLTFKGWLAA